MLPGKISNKFPNIYWVELKKWTSLLLNTYKVRQRIHRLCRFSWFLYNISRNAEKCFGWKEDGFSVWGKALREARWTKHAWSETNLEVNIPTITAPELPTSSRTAKTSSYGWILGKDLEIMRDYGSGSRGGVVGGGVANSAPRFCKSRLATKNLSADG